MVIEWGYNVHDALLRYDYDSNVSMFGAILKGEVGNCYEFVYVCRPSVSSVESMEWSVFEVQKGILNNKNTLVKRKIVFQRSKGCLMNIYHVN